MAQELWDLWRRNCGIARRNCGILPGDPHNWAWCYGRYHQPQCGRDLSQQSRFSGCTDVVASAGKEGRKHFLCRNHGFRVLLTARDGVKHGRMPIPER